MDAILGYFSDTMDRKAREETSALPDISSIIVLFSTQIAFFNFDSLSNLIAAALLSMTKTLFTDGSTKISFAFRVGFK